MVGLLYALFGSFVVWRIVLPDNFTLAGLNQVTLEAKPWNDGKVYAWHDLNEGPDTLHIDIADGTRCDRIDNEWYRLGSGVAAIYYYKLNCNGVIGYVERDQTR